MSKYICPICKAKMKNSINARMWHGMIHRSKDGIWFPTIFGGKRK